MEKAIEKQDEKIMATGSRVEEVILRHELLTWDPPPGTTTPPPGYFLRIARLESQTNNLHQRLATTEEQIGWMDQKLRGFWIIGASTNPADAIGQIAHLKNV